MRESNQPRVSIVLPYYNGKQFIKETIDSIIGQTYKNFELLIIDDGSPSAEDVRVLKECIEKFNDNRISYQWKPNGGLSDARNFGIQAAKGEIIAFQDQDDLWEPTKLEKQIGVFDKFPDTQVVVTDGVFFGEREGNIDASKIVSGKPSFVLHSFDRMLWGNFVIASSIVFTKALSDKVGNSNRRYFIIPDYELFIRFAEKCDFFIIPERLVKYRLHGANTSKAKFRGFAEYLCILAERDLPALRSRLYATLAVFRIMLYFLGDWFKKLV